MKVLNIKGIIIVVAVLVVFQLAFGLVLSPILGKVIIGVANKSTPAKIEVGSVNVWPLTLSFSMSGLKVFDPDDTGKKMVEVKKASFRMSPLALLSKRLVVSGISMSDVIINLEGEPDGSFNVAKLARPKEGAEKTKTSFLDRFRGKKDMFGKLYDMVKSRNKSGSGEEAKKARKEARKVKTEVVQLPRGRRVEFKTLRDDYLVEIRKLSIRNARINVKAQTGEEVQVERASVAMKGVAVDPVNGALFRMIKLKGGLRKAEKEAGSFNLAYDSGLIREGVQTDIVFTARKVDLPAVMFMFQESLPVDVRRGTLDMDSKTRIVNEDINSRNNLTLRGQDLEAKGKQTVAGFIPMPTLCEALDQVDPLKFDFTITGTLDKPQFGGLEDTLKEIAQPYLTNVAEKTAKSALEGIIKKDTGGAAGGGSTERSGEQVVDSLKSLFGGEKK